jgi:predicted phage tail protein
MVYLRLQLPLRVRRLYDPRDGTTAWSDNPALCIRDYITSGYGLGEDAAQLDDTLVSAAANVCDETDTEAGTTRYTCNGAFLTSATPYDMLNDLLTSMGGMLWYAQGKWRMKPAYWTEPVLSLTNDDLRSGLNVSTRHSRRDNFNIVKGTFRGEESNWQVTDYPEVKKH